MHNFHSPACFHIKHLSQTDKNRPNSSAVNTDAVFAFPKAQTHPLTTTISTTSAHELILQHEGVGYRSQQPLEDENSSHLL